jgi:hypothetical protein
MPGALNYALGALFSLSSHCFSFLSTNINLVAYKAAVQREGAATVAACVSGCVHVCMVNVCLCGMCLHSCCTGEWQHM